MQNLDYVFFRLDSLVMAIPTTDVRSVERAVLVSPLPEAPAPVVGVVNYSGEPVPVLDLRTRMGLSSREISIEDHFLFAYCSGRLLALCVDGVSDVVSIPRKEVREAESFWPGLKLLRSVSGHEGSIILVHELENVLDEGQEMELEEALRKAVGKAEAEDSA